MMNKSRFHVFWVILFSVVQICPILSDAANLKTVELVTFQLIKLNGDDSYPEYMTLAPHGQLQEPRMSLRCVDNGYDTVKGRTVSWHYQEIMIFDSNGSIIKRKEPRANVTNERGFAFTFATLKECNDAEPMVFGEGTVCKMTVQLNRKLRKAKLISSDCK